MSMAEVLLLHGNTFIFHWNAKKGRKKRVSKLGVINESDFPSSTGSARREGGDCFPSDSLLLERKVSSVVEDQCSSTGRKPEGLRSKVLRPGSIRRGVYP